MVFKEEVISWFKDLESFKRIDVLYELLNMCVPFELRFLGTCVEDMGKRNYQELLTPTDNFNNLDKLKKDVVFNKGLCEEGVRHRLLLCLSLLSSRNVSVAEWLYKKLLRTEYFNNGVVCEISKSDVLQSEFLLLYTMANYHPAFTFDQKKDFYEILARLIDIRENRISPKPSAFDYLPGFDYTKNKNFAEPPVIPVKTAPTLSYNETIVHQPPPGLPQMQQPPPPPPSTIPPPVDYMWNRPGFQCGAPELGAFNTAAPISPLVSQTGSPSHSRSTSPHRTQMGVRTQPPLIPTVPPIPTMEILSQSSLPLYNPDIKLPEEEGSIHEEKPMPWPASGLITAPPPAEFKQNGMRFAPPPPPYTGGVNNKRQQHNFIEQMQSMSLVDGDNPLHNSNSSSNSSPNQTPPGTPSSTIAGNIDGGAAAAAAAATVAVAAKGRLNGIQFGPAPGTAICDAISPPPPQPPTAAAAAAAPFNCPVPYSYPQSFPPIPPQPTRSFICNPPIYRQPFTAQYPTTYQTDNSFPPYNIPYVNVIISSHFPPTRTPPGCYNCGAPNHLGNDCTAQNIDEITQKNTYQLDYSAAVPDADK